MPKKSVKNLSKEQWLNERHGKIGSSLIGTIVGVNPYSTPYDAYTELTVAKPILREESPKMRRGIEMEPLLHELFQKLHPEMKVRNDNTIASHPDNPRFVANLDRTIVDRKDGKGPGILELKTADTFSKRTWNDGIPLQYYAQIQWQLYVKGWLWGFLYIKVTDSWEDMEFYVERNDEYIALLVEQATEFLRIVDAQDVDAIPITVKDYDKMTPDPASKVVATDAITKLCEMAADYSQQKKDAEANEKAVKEQIRMFAGKSELIVDEKGEVLATYRQTTRKGYQVPEKTYRSLQVKSRKETNGREDND